MGKRRGEERGRYFNVAFSILGAVAVPFNILSSSFARGCWFEERYSEFPESSPRLLTERMNVKLRNVAIATAISTAKRCLRVISNDFLCGWRFSRWES